MAEWRKDQYNYSLEVARGNIPGQSHVNKFGYAPDGVQTTETDIWERSDATPTQQIWVAPTAARVHQIVSSSGSDDGNPVGVGARTVKVYGLTDWDTAEVSETLTMNGITNVPTSNSYVIIYRIRVLTKGATNTNVGTITATADTDGTITALILPGAGTTKMAIFGVPSTQVFYMHCYWGSLNKAQGAAATADFILKQNPEPDAELLNFISRDHRGLQSTGVNDQTWWYDPPKKFAGPCIIKVMAFGSASDLNCTAGFDGIMVDN